MNAESIIDLWERMSQFIQIADQQDAADDFMEFLDDYGMIDDIEAIKHDLPAKLKVAYVSHMDIDDEDDDGI